VWPSACRRSTARGCPALPRGGLLGLDPGDAVQKALADNLAGHGLPGGRLGLAFGKGFKPTGGDLGVILGSIHARKMRCRNSRWTREPPRLEHAISPLRAKPSATSCQGRGQCGWESSNHPRIGDDECSMAATLRELRVNYELHNLQNSLPDKMQSVVCEPRHSWLDSFRYHGACHKHIKMSGVTTMNDVPAHNRKGSAYQT
jgi:hypothetical protein